MSADHPNPSDAGDTGPTDPGEGRRATLEGIVARKREEVERSKSRQSVADLQEKIAELGRPRNFFAAVTKHRRPVDMSVIAEVKRRSPSAGLLRPEYADGFDPVAIARRYHANGAAAISCLTDREHFGGDIEFIHQIRDAMPLPVLRKDFIVDTYQVWEARAAGADAILLIAECLEEHELLDLLILATELQMTTLLEVHDVENLLKVRPHIGFPHPQYTLLGINNRNLKTMTTDLGHTFRLGMVENPDILVSESGIRTAEDVARLQAAGIHRILVGEHLLRQDDVGAALRALMG